MVTVVTTLVEVQELLAEATVGGGQLEGPEEVGALLEVGSDGVDLVDQILDGEDIELAEDLLDLLVLHQRNALLVQLSESTLVDQLTDGLEVGVTVGDVGLDQTEHLHSGLVQAHEDGVVDLAQAEELEGLLHLGGGLVDTANTDNNGQTTLGLSEQMTLGASLSSLVDEISLHLSVLLLVLLRALDHLLSLGLLSGNDISGELLGGGLQLSITALLDNNGLGPITTLANVFPMAFRGPMSVTAERFVREGDRLVPVIGRSISRNQTRSEIPGPSKGLDKVYPDGRCKTQTSYRTK